MPSFPETEVKLAQENSIQPIRAARADPAFLVNERFQKAVFGDHPYGFVLPDEKSINALTRAGLRTFVREVLSSKRFASDRRRRYRRR